MIYIDQFRLFLYQSSWIDKLAQFLSRESFWSGMGSGFSFNFYQTHKNVERVLSDKIITYLIGDSHSFWSIVEKLSPKDSIQMHIYEDEHHGIGFDYHIN